MGGWRPDAGSWMARILIRLTSCDCAHPHARHSARLCGAVRAPRRLAAREARPTAGLQRDGLLTARGGAGGGHHPPGRHALGHYRRVSAAGTMLYDREVVYAGRSHEGSPGVDLLTPHEDRRARHRGDGEPRLGVLVRCGVASTTRAGRRRDSRASRDTRRRSRAPSGGPRNGGCTRSIARRSRRSSDSRSRRTCWCRLLTATRTRDSVPGPADDPVLDEGPHKSYAMQWFSFAIIAVVGGVALSRRSR